jgi:hypothetical protein
MAMDGEKVMDVATAMAMDGLLAMQRQWTGDGDGRCNSEDDERRVVNATTMDGSSVARR